MRSNTITPHKSLVSYRKRLQPRTYWPLIVWALPTRICRFSALISNQELSGKRCLDPSKVVVTVAHRMILKDELASERSIAIERHGRGAIQFFIGESTDCRGRRRTVVCQQRERGFLCNAVILFRVVAVHRVDGIPRHAGDRLAGSEKLARWISTGYMLAT